MIGASDRNGGFTLIELLVATTLLALLSVLLFGGLRFGARAWEAGGASMERSGEIEAVQDLLRRTLAEAAAPEPAGDKQPGFVGEAGRARFFAPMPRHIATGGLGRYALDLDEAGHLLMSWEPRRPERKLEAPIAGEPSVILQNVESLKLEYYGAAGEDGAGWRDSWSSPALPLLVRVQVGFADGDGRRWPDLLIAPRLARAN
jgi:general secretion pathway protein J